MQYGSTYPERTLAAAGLGEAVGVEGEMMTDVVELARARRADLVIEIAKIDDFVRMAELLEKYSERLLGAPVVEADASAAETPTVDLAFEDVFTVDYVTTGDEVAAKDGVAVASTTVAATVEPAVTIKCDLTDAFADTAIARELARKPKADLASIDPDHFAFDQKAAANPDELVLINPVSGDPGPVDVHIGQRLRQRRWMMGMSQRQLGDIVGVEFDQIQTYETGAARISVRQMWDIAAALEVPVSYFFEGLEGQAVDTGEARTDVLTDEEALEMVGVGQSARRA